jgi:hypothetical protein
MTAADIDTIAVCPGFARKLFVWLQLLSTRGTGAMFVGVAVSLLGVLILSTMVAVGLSLWTGSFSPLLGPRCAILLMCCAPLTLVIRSSRVATPAWYATVEQVIGRDGATALRARLTRHYRADHILAQIEVIGALTLMFAEHARARTAVRWQKSGLRVGMLRFD